MGTTPINSYLKGLRHYATSRGRASRSEFWCFHLVAFAVDLVAAAADLLLKLPPFAWGYGPLLTIAWAVQALPMIGVAMRRFHDINCSAGWWLVPGSTFIVGFPRGNHGPNRFGPDPLLSLGPVGRGPIIYPALPSTDMPPVRSASHGVARALADIERLGRLRTDGLLSSSEFDVLKAAALKTSLDVKASSPDALSDGSARHG